MGIMGMCGSLGMGIGPVLGSWMSKEWSTTAMFFTSSAAAMLSIIVIAGMKETLTTRKKFTLSDLKISSADLFDRGVIAPVIVMFLTIFSFAIIINIIPDFTDHLDIPNRGLFNFIFVSVSIVVRLLGGTISDRIGRVVTLRIGVTFLTIGMICLGFTENVAMFITSGIIIGIAIGLNSPALFAWNSDLANPGYMGRAMSSLFIGIEAGVIVASVTGMKLYDNDPNNFSMVFWYGAGASLAALLYLNFIKKDKIHKLEP